MTTTAESELTSFVERYEPRLRTALMSAYGPERGREATCEALARVALVCKSNLEPATRRPPDHR